MLKIGLDIDNVLADFDSAYRIYFSADRFPEMLESDVITDNVNAILISDRKFWINLPVINKLDFTPKLYCTKRVNKKAWSKKWLEINHFPKAPVYQIFGNDKKKSPYIKGRVDVFIDDSVTNFIEMNLAGIPCLLYATEANEPWGNIGKIHSLDYKSIEKEYKIYVEKYFFNFKEILVTKKDAESLYQK